MTDILNVDRGTRETSCNDLPSALHKKSAKTLLEEIKDFQEDIEFEINHLNENATHSENIQLVSTMNEVKKTYRVILKVL